MICFNVFFICFAVFLHVCIKVRTLKCKAFIQMKLLHFSAVASLPTFSPRCHQAFKKPQKVTKLSKNKCSSLKRFWTKMKIMILTRVWSVRSAWVAISWITRTAGDHSCHYRCHLQHYQHHFNDLSDQPARGVGRTRERLSDVTTSIGAL